MSALPLTVASTRQGPSFTVTPATSASNAGFGVVTNSDVIMPPSGRPDGLGQSFQSMKNNGVDVNSSSHSRSTPSGRSRDMGTAFRRSVFAMASVNRIGELNARI